VEEPASPGVKEQALCLTI